MPTITYEEVIPSPIPNTTIMKGIVDGVHRNYQITANEGYVLHDKDMDMPIYDETYTYEIGVTLGYSAGTCSCGKNYDWEANPREFYAVLRTEVPADQIFGGVTPPTETI